MPQPNDLSRSLVALDQNSTIIAVVEMSQSSWLVGGDFGNGQWFRRAACLLGDNYCEQGQLNTQPEH